MYLQNKKMLQKDYHLDELPETARFLLQNTQSRIWLFDGEMGSGKTTLIKQVVKELGGDDRVSSPTFSIVNEYITPNYKVYHFDLYRLEDEMEALDFGIEEYFDTADAYVFIEWPDKIPNLLPANSQKIRIIVTDFLNRNLQIL